MPRSKIASNSPTATPTRQTDGQTDGRGRQLACACARWPRAPAVRPRASFPNSCESVQCHFRHHPQLSSEPRASSSSSFSTLTPPAPRTPRQVRVRNTFQARALFTISSHHIRAGRKRVRLTDTLHFVAPGQGDLRVECPLFNTARNEGYAA